MRLRSSLEKTRDSVAPLIARIQQQLPRLTIHDISHIDELWHIADVIVGDDQSLNPAEVYVLGVAFLMHDSATSTFAFSGGVDEVRNTLQWKDYISQAGLKDSEVIPGTEEFQVALFETLRLLHAPHASKMLSQKWKDLNGHERFLVEDDELRVHYGPLIGAIAASHGESAANSESRWSSAAPMAPHACLKINSDVNWCVDQLKLALILRCVDAAHIDSLRAPDFEAMFVQPKGESRRHWYFQNRLSSINIDNKLEVYWSSSPFPKDEADAWWRCYETCQMIDQEIRSANKILLNNARPTLRAKGVAGVDNIDVFKENISVCGWQPTDFTFKVTQVGGIIELFGGRELYGDEPRWAVRELIQNSSDAIRARRLHCGRSTYSDIRVRLRLINEDWWFEVQDTGIGMSHYVLTEVLLDFGRSLWGDSALRQQWTGLSSKGFSSVGKFGIGFFSVLMLGDEVKVSTWPFGHAQTEQLTLHLRNRTKDRPLLIETEEHERLDDFGTRVSVKLARGRSSLLMPPSQYLPWDERKKEETLDELIGRIAPASEFDIYVADKGREDKRVIVANDWKKISAEKLLKRVNPKIRKADLARLSKKLENIYDHDGEIVGRATMDGSSNYVREACSLVHRGIYAGECEDIQGILVGANNKDLARKSSYPVAGGEAITSWAFSQMRDRAGHEQFNLIDKAISLGVLDKDLIIAEIAGNYVTMAEVLQSLRSAKVQTFKVLADWPECPSHISESNFENMEISDDIIVLPYGGETRSDFGMSGWIKEILPESDIHPRTIVGYFTYIIQREFPESDWYVDDRVIGRAASHEIEAECYVFNIPAS